MNLLSDEQLYYGRAIEDAATGFLTAFVRMIHPTAPVECGTYPGRSTRAILDGLDSGVRLDTYEYVPVAALRMRDFFADEPRVRVRAGGPPSFAKYDFAFIDSGPTYAERTEDLRRWIETAPFGGIAALDDTAGEDWPQARAGLESRWARSLSIRYVDLPSEHGVTIVRKG